MATNDFIQDLVEKLSEDSVEYLVVALQKGKSDINGPKSHAFYSIHSADGAEMIHATIQEVMAQDDIIELLESNVGDGNDIDIDDAEAFRDDDDWKEGAD